VALTILRVLKPDLIGVLLGLHLDPGLAYGTYNDVDAVIVHGQYAFMIICPRMISAVDLLAAVTLEGQEVLLLAEPEGAVLTNVSEFHVIVKI
jgi:hypothetical protein